MQQPINPNRDRDMTDYLYSALLRLPGEIGGIEAEAAALINVKRETVAALEDAELNTTLAAPPDGKNAEMRALQIKATLAHDETVKRLRGEVMKTEAELEMNEAEAKSKRREFQAAIALAELHAARINSMYRYQAQPATQQNHNPKTQ